jgi:hypothetical protein
MAEATFIRPSFTPFPPKIAESAKDDVITSIGELILFNAIYNPNHIFCIQAQPKTHDVQPQHRVPNDGIRTTFAELHLAVTECSSWLCKANLQRTTQANSNGASSIVSPVALYLESDIGLFVHLAALQSLNIPVRVLHSSIPTKSSIRALLTLFDEIGPPSVHTAQSCKRATTAQNHWLASHFGVKANT